MSTLYRSILNVQGSSFASTNSFEFDGSTDFIDCGNPTSLQITGALTISAWFKTTYTGGTQMIVGKDNIATTGRNYILYYSTVANSMRMNIFKTGQVISIVSATSTVTDGNWHHVMGVNDGTDLKIYIDGVLEGTNSGGGGTIQKPWQALGWH